MINIAEWAPFMGIRKIGGDNKFITTKIIKA
jgi:hypothetical protein